MVDEVRDEYGWKFESVKRTELHQFKVMPRRWVVERTIGWMNNWRALSKHYDVDSSTSETQILLASIFYLSKRLTHREPEAPINHALDARLRQMTKKNADTITQNP